MDGPKIPCMSTMKRMQGSSPWERQDTYAKVARISRNK